MEDKVYDYIILGAGVGGAIAADKVKKLTSNFLIVEQGGWPNPKNFTHKKSLLKYYRNSGVNPIFGKHIFSYAEGQGVGGGSVINGGLIWRTPDHILEEWISKYPENYHVRNISRYFDEVERELSVTIQKDYGNSVYDFDSYYLEKQGKRKKQKVVNVPRALKGCVRKNNCPSGCIVGAKQSLDKVYFKKVKDHILVEHRVLSVKKKGDLFSVKIKSDQGLKKIFSKKLVVSLGAVNSGFLLLNNKLIKSRSLEFQFHVNLKSIVVFKDNVFAQKGTMFTKQLQEYEKENIYIMPTNFNKVYLNTVSAGFSDDIKVYLNENLSKSAIYTTQIRPESKGRIRSFLGQKVVTNNFSKNDYKKMKRSLKILCELLFSDEVESIILPSRRGLMVTNENYIQAIDTLDPRGLDLLSVHLMSSVPLNSLEAGGLLNSFGELYESKGVFVLDSSILPSNIGESPQGTIMALAKSIVNTWTN